MPMSKTGSLLSLPWSDSAHILSLPAGCMLIIVVAESSLTMAFLERSHQFCIQGGQNGIVQI